MTTPVTETPMAMPCAWCKKQPHESRDRPEDNSILFRFCRTVDCVEFGRKIYGESPDWWNDLQRRIAARIVEAQKEGFNAGWKASQDNDPPMICMSDYWDDWQKTVKR